MAISGINLLPRKKVSPEEKKILTRIRAWVAIILVGYTLFVAGLFSFSVFLTYQQNEVKNKISKLEEGIKTAQKKESLELALKGRIVEMGKIMKDRVDYVQLINKVQSITPMTLKYTRIDFSIDKVSISGEAESVLVLGDFLDKLKTETPDFSKINLTLLSRGKKATYSFTFDAFF